MVTTVIFDNEVPGLGAEADKKCQAICTNYRDLQLHIMDLDETELLQCIVVERSYRKRANILTRLYARYSELRKNRERLELLQ